MDATDAQELDQWRAWDARRRAADRLRKQIWWDRLTEEERNDHRRRQRDRKKAERAAARSAKLSAK